METYYTATLITTWRGLRVIAVHRPHSKTFAASLMYHAGTFDDPPHAPGTAHFAEHLAFTGPNKELSERLASLGTHVNGCTHYDYTEFPVRGHVDGLPLSLEFFANIVQNPPVTSELIASELSVFIHELQEADSPDSRSASWDAFWRRTIGDPNWRRNQMKAVKVKRFTAELLTSFKQRYYDAANAALAIVSPLEDQELQKLLERRWPAETTSLPATGSLASSHAPVVRPLTINWDFNPYIWADVAHSTDDTTPTMRLAANIIGHHMGGGPHSELFRTLRTERAIAYSAYADDLAYLGGTIMHCFFCVHRRSLHEALDFVVTQLDEIAAQGITEEQFEREKRRILRWHEMSMDHPHGLAAFLAYEALRRPAESLPADGSFHQKLHDLTLEDLKRAASKLLSKHTRATFAAGFVGPVARLRIRRRLRRSAG